MHTCDDTAKTDKNRNEPEQELTFKFCLRTELEPEPIKSLKFQSLVKSSEGLKFLLTNNLTFFTIFNYLNIVSFYKNIDFITFQNSNSRLK